MPQKALSAEERAAAFEAWSAGHRPTPALSDYAVTRESMYEERWNIAEFWNVATRPANVNGLGLSHEEVLQEVSGVERLLTMLPDIPAIYAAWKEIVRDHQSPGSQSL